MGRRTVTAEELMGAIVVDVSEYDEALITVQCTNGTRVVFDLWNSYVEWVP